MGLNVREGAGEMEVKEGEVDDLRTWLYGHKRHGDNHESQLWLIMKGPLTIVFVGSLVYQFLAAWWAVGSPWGMALLFVLEVGILSHYYKKSRKGTEQERLLRELAKTKQV